VAAHIWKPIHYHETALPCLKYHAEHRHHILKRGLTFWSTWNATLLPEPPESRSIAPWSRISCHSILAPALAFTSAGSIALAGIPIVMP
jgi:hypothetical protein